MQAEDAAFGDIRARRSPELLAGVHIIGRRKAAHAEIRAAQTRNGPVEVLAGAETIGTVDRDSEDGEVAYHITITLLAEDLPNV